MKLFFFFLGFLIFSTHLHKGLAKENDFNKEINSKKRKFHETPEKVLYNLFSPDLIVNEAKIFLARWSDHLRSFHPKTIELVENGWEKASARFDNRNTLMSTICEELDSDTLINDLWGIVYGEKDFHEIEALPFETILEKAKKQKAKEHEYIYFEKEAESLKTIFLNFFKENSAVIDPRMTYFWTKTLGDEEALQTAKEFYDNNSFDLGELHDVNDATLVQIRKLYPSIFYMLALLYPEDFTPHNTEE